MRYKRDSRSTFHLLLNILCNIFEEIRVLSLISVEIWRILQYNVLIMLCANCELWRFHYVGKLQTVMASSH